MKMLRRSTTIDVTMIGLCTALVAISAFIRIPLPMVPITLQILMVVLAGMLLGPLRGAVSVLLYVLIGLAGLPIFTQGGGLSYVYKPSFGYLLGMIVGAAVVGWLSAMRKPSFLWLLVSGFAGLIVVYIFGVVYMHVLFNHVVLTPGMDWRKLISIGVLVPLPGDCIKLVLAALVGQRLIPLLRED
ncbi:MAG: biotin transporter BioY [Lachnospiraceae bacterium]|nr:biotin transporter BioY [Lachnospiraceae bacterium]MDY5743000.1 biotin transporter BioY [Lachnospiraceae bacterium]